MNTIVLSTAATSDAPNYVHALHTLGISADSATELKQSSQETPET